MAKGQKAAKNTGGHAVSPLAPKTMAKLPPLAGVRMATGEAGVRYKDRTDVLLAILAPGTQAAGVFTKSKTASAPVDWCKRQLDASKGEDVRALVVNAGCANSFTGKPGADAARRVASAIAKRFDCRQRDVMLASTGVIGVLLDDGKIIHR